MAQNGLKQGDNGLEIYVMCEIPNNVVQIDAFSRLFDGFSIGSNDLTQLTLGVDRDSEIVAFDFERIVEQARTNMQSVLDQTDVLVARSEQRFDTTADLYAGLHSRGVRGCCAKPDIRGRGGRDNICL